MKGLVELFTPIVNYYQNLEQKGEILSRKERLQLDQALRIIAVAVGQLANDDATQKVEPLFDDDFTEEEALEAARKGSPWS